ncbi:MAG: 50S ribosomal protein L21, partial [Planctomycetota bacterium]
QELAIDYRDLTAGESVTFDRVLAVGQGGDLKLGAPTVDGASVSAEVLGTTQGEKVDVQKIRRRKNSRRHTGHRKMLTKVKVTGIAG